MSNALKYEELNGYVFVTKLAGFEHTNYIQGKATRTPEASDDIPMVQGKNVRNGFFVDEYDWYISKDISDSLPRSVLDKPCILIPYVGSNLGEVGLFPNTHICHLASNIAKVEVCSDKYLLEYVLYYLQSDIGQSFLFQSKQGSAQPNITMDSIRHTQIIERSKKQQQNICDVLSVINKKIQLNSLISTQLETFAKTLYDFWFTQFDFPNAEGNPYRASGGEMVWNDQLKREIPKGWSVTTIGDITENYDSLRVPLSQNQRETVKGNIPYYGATGVLDYVNTHIFDGQYVLIAEDGSVVDSNGNPVVQIIWGKTWVNNHAHVLRGTAGISNELLYLILQRIPVIKIMTGSIQKKITQDNLNGYQIPMIPEKTAAAFHTFVAPMFSEIESLRKQNNELVNLRDWLLPMLMNGQATVE